jgi:hypothetical protein
MIIFADDPNESAHAYIDFDQQKVIFKWNGNEDDPPAEWEYTFADLTTGYTTSWWDRWVAPLWESGLEEWLPEI